MKRFAFALGLLALLAGQLPAQTYESMWKEAAAAAEKDLPQTVLGIVGKVRARALAEKNDAQLLKAMLVAGQSHYEVSPDSGKVLLAQMEEALSQEQRPVEKALWHMALAQTYKQGFAAGLLQDGERVRLAGGHLAEALADFGVLADAHTADYLPLFVQKSDSRRLYGDDILSVVAAEYVGYVRLGRDERRSMAHRLSSFYAARGNGQAALLAAIDSIGLTEPFYGPLEGNACYKALLALAGENEASPLNVETYINIIGVRDYSGDDGQRGDSLLLQAARRGLQLYGKEKRAAVLRNFIQEKEQPSVTLSSPSQTLYPGKDYKLPLRARNVGKVSLRLSRLDLDARSYAGLEGHYKALLKRKKGKATTIVHSFKPTDAYRWQTDSITLCVSDPGIYLCELLLDGKLKEHEVIHVSSVRPVMLALTDGRTRVALVDAISGTPFKDGRIVACDNGNGSRQLEVYEPDGEGNFFLPKKTAARVSFYPVRGADSFAPSFSLAAYSAFAGSPSASATRMQLFTDRAIYRPGQKLSFGGVVYTQQGDDLKVEKGALAKIFLLNVNGKAVDSLTVVSDEYGSFGGEMSLPGYCVPGYFSLTGKMASVSGRTSFRVEEYKRPTFTVKAEDVTAEYALGDTVEVAGVAETYTGLPLEGAKVRWSVSRRVWLRAGGSADPLSGEAVCDEKGRFVVPVLLFASAEERAKRPADRYFYTVSFDVTADNGETVTATTTLRASAAASWFESSWPATVCKESLPEITVKRNNSAGRNIPGEARYEILSGGQVVASVGFHTGEAFVPQSLLELPSGAYKVRVKQPQGKRSGEDWERDFLLFSESDVRPVGDGVQWQHVRMSERRDSAFVMVGSPRDSVTLFYDLFTKDGLQESRRVVFSDSLLHFHLAYKPEYGESARATFAFVKDGILYDFSVDVEKPVPDKRLSLQWSTFRSRLVPGQQEEWRLTVRKPDGTPARAAVMARLYDASLDALAVSPWNFGGLSFYRFPVAVYWRMPFNPSFSLTGYEAVKYADVPALELTGWDASLYAFFAHGNSDGTRASVAYGKQASADSGVNQQAGTTVYATMKTRAAAKNLAEAVVADSAPAAEEKAAAGEAVPARTNFAETAFFHPSLHTDSTGAVSIAFTLPESLTSWNFNALAHSPEMDFGFLDTTVVARKDFMVQAALPRFLRKGDRTELPATLRNLTARELKGTVVCTLSDPQTGQALLSLKESFRLLPNGAQTFAFPCEAAGDSPLLVCRITASGDGFSDGEEHYLPVVSDLVAVTRTLPFSMREEGVRTLQLDTLLLDGKATNRRLTVEVSSNPTWYAVAALPSLVGGACHSAVDWATRYYALELGGHVALRNPEIRKEVEASAASGGTPSVLSPYFAELAEESPWLREAEGEQERAAALKLLLDPETAAARKHSALDNLRALQQPDGSWGWYKGMKGSPQITAEVAILLARLARLTGDKSAAPELEQAFGFLQQEAARQVKEEKAAAAKAKEVSAPSEWQLRYLYLRSLMGRKPDAEAAYLLAKVEKHAAGLTMYGKALSAVVLSEAGREAAARTCLQSLLEHTVSTPEMGRYFDTDRAQWSWSSYKIPTQTAAIEALSMLGSPAADAGKLPAVEEMRLWLLQSKRTQMWETSRATADAVYVLLAASGQQGAVRPLEEKTPLYYALNAGKKIVGFNAQSEAQAPSTLGYSRHVYDDASPAAALWKTPSEASVTLRQTAPGLSWGSIFSTGTLPAAEVAAQSSGLSVSRRFEVKRAGQWQPLPSGEAVRVGERVRQVFVLTADRDYDFVSLKSARPACFEPVRPLSGYAWQDGLGSYRVVRDASTEHFFEQIRKGSHTFSEEYFVDRSGRFQCGVSEVRSVYAPEFGGMTGGASILVE